MGRIWFMLSSIFAENEREILKERTNAGLASAKARGTTGGRPKGLTDAAKQVAKSAASLHIANQMITDEICKVLGIGSKTTYYRYLRHEGVEINGWTKTPKVSR
jgi:DNA invertase Pin-like site-specific DNA recombinase